MPCPIGDKYRPRAAPRSSGFTLIEVLVVLVLAGSISSLLFEALERAYRLQERFGIELFGTQQGQMATDWYRQTVQGMRPDYPDGRNQFKGGEKEFSGLTGNSLGNNYGAPTPISWQVRRNLQNGLTELMYIEYNKETPILSWQTKEVRFVYIDDQQAPHDTWPPPLGLWPQLPSQIQLVALSGSAVDATTIVATPICTAMPPPRIKDL